jgi:hypothetical protein
VLALGAASTAIPASGAATPRQPALAFGTTPIKLGNGFTLRVGGVGIAFFGGKLLTVHLSRTVGRVVEEHVWSFTLPPSRLQVRPDDSGASVSTAALMGPYGAISLRATVRGEPRKARECGASGWRRNATFTGTFRFNSRSPFGAVTKRTLAGWVGLADCAPGFRHEVCGKHDRLYAWAGSTRLEAERWPDGFRFVRYTLTDSSAKPATVNHQITLLSPPANALTLGADMAMSALDLGSGAPLLTGSLAFTATSAATTAAIACNDRKVPSRSGTTAGTITATFAHLGPQTFANPAGQVARYP